MQQTTWGFSYSGSLIRVLRKLFIAFVAAPAVMFAMTFWIDPKGTATLPFSEATTAYGAGALSLVLLLISFVLPSIASQRLEQRLGGDLRAKLTGYLTGKVFASALCEAPALLWVVMVLITGNPWYAIGTAICLTTMLARFPNQFDLENAIGKSAKDIDRELAQPSPSK